MLVRWVALAIIVAALVWGLEQVVVSPLDTGSIYPQYSSLRSDPMGAMALYESLSKVLKVDRLYKSRMLNDPGAGTAIFVLGVDPASWVELDNGTLKEYEELTSKGARLVISFLPVSKSFSKEERPVERRWDIRLNGKSLHPGPEWKTIDREWDAVERPLGAGSVVLLWNSYPLSNEGLRETHDAALIAGLAGPVKEVIFDENHFGVVESGSIAKLMRKYHLEWALAILAVVAALFLWRSASSLLPSRAPRPEEAVSGRDSLEGMTALLRRGIAEQELLRICYEEWQKTSINDHKTSKMDVDEALFDHKNVVAGYKALMENL